MRTQAGEDITAAFERGAQAALELSRQHRIRLALLAARSPSCGNESIYDGRFSGRLVPGAGITAARLQAAGIRVFNPDQIEQAAEYLARLECTTGEPT